MENYSSVVLAIAMVAAFLLIGGGVKLALERPTRLRGILMIAAGLVIVGNVLIWTL
jgi:high-affinity Fe2+/Pb2+ permease